MTSTIHNISMRIGKNGIYTKSTSGNHTRDGVTIITLWNIMFFKLLNKVFLNETKLFATIFSTIGSTLLLVSAKKLSRRFIGCRKHKAKVTKRSTKVLFFVTAIILTCPNFTTSLTKFTIIYSIIKTEKSMIMRALCIK